MSGVIWHSLSNDCDDDGDDDDDDGSLLLHIIAF